MKRDLTIPLVLVIAVGAIVLALVLRPESSVPSSRFLAVESRNTFQVVCATCHGSRGEGNRELGAPSIASLPEWYVMEQLGKFRSGLRGAHPRDLYGQQMRAAVFLLTDDALAAAVTELLSFPPVIPTPTLVGNLTEGAQSYRELCMECHRYNGQGELVFKSSPLAGLPDWYLAGQMAKFTDGIRGYHPDDDAGAKMRDMAKRPSGEEELNNILSYIATLARDYPLEK